MESGKRVLIISHTRAVSNFKIGSHHYANQLAKNGNDVTFIGTPYSFIHKMFGKKKQGIIQIEEAIKVKELKFLLPITMKRNTCVIIINKFLNLLFNAHNRKENNYDVVICDYPFFEPYIDIFKFKNLVYRPTDNYSSMSGDKVLEYERRLLEKANCTIATSKEVAAELALKNPIRDSIEVINNGYDDDVFFIDKDVVKNGAVYIGAIDYRFDIKAIECLAGAFVDDEFSIYGPIDAALKGEVRRLELKLKNLKFCGPISYKETAVKLRAAKVGLLPLNDSGANRGRSPMKLWEYAASGLNVLYRGVNLDYRSEVSFLYEYKNHNELLDSYLKARDSAFLENQLVVVKNQSWKEKTKKMLIIINKNQSNK